MALYGGVEIVGRPDLENIRRLDMLPMKALAEMHSYGMAVDKEYFAALSAQLEDEMKVLRYDIVNFIPSARLDQFLNESVGHGDDEILNVDSPDQVAELLFSVLGVGEGHRLKMTKGGGRPSTDKKQLEKFKTHPAVAKVLQYKERAKLLTTYTRKIPEIAKFHHEGLCWCGWKHFGETWRVHCDILATRTATGRLATKNINLQNIPARTELGAKVRLGFVASPGMEIVDVDFGQFEMRLGAHYSNDANLIKIFSDKLDPHTFTAMKVFKLDQEIVESKEGRMLYRAPSKNLNFGIFYGLTSTGLFDQMLLTYATANTPVPDWLNQDWCEQFIKDWFELYSGVTEYLEKQYYRARRYGIVWTLFGRVRRVPEVRSVHSRIVAAGLRQAGNLPVQGSQADLNKLSIAEIQDMVIDRARSEGIAAHGLISIHDQMLTEVEQGYGELVRDMKEDVMSRCMTDRETGVNMCRVEITADGKVANRWIK